MHCKRNGLALSLAMALSYVAYGANTITARAAERAAPTQTSAEQASTMKLRLKAGDKVITATLMDNATSRDFVSLLPMSVTLEDYAATEKISYLPRKLSTEGAPAGSTPSTGDIAYYVKRAWLHTRDDRVCRLGRRKFGT